MGTDQQLETQKAESCKKRFADRAVVGWGGILVIAFIVYFIGLTFKPNDVATDSNILPAIVDKIKSLNVYFFLCGLALMAGYLLLSDTVKRFRFSPPMVLYTMFFIYLILRLFYDDPSSGKLVVALIGQCLLTAFIAVYFGPRNFLARRAENFVTALSVWSIIYTLVSLGVLLAGYGYPRVVPRFFGITAHPNFAGFAFAVASISLFDLSFRKLSGYIFRSASSILFLTAVTLCVLTGSRNSISMCVLSLFLYIFLRYGDSFVSKILVVATFVVLAGVFISLLNSPLFESYEMLTRGDNRSTAWQSMMDGVARNPLFGVGAETEGSENSYFRALAFTGAIFGSLFTASFLSTGYYVIRMLLHRRFLVSTVTSMPLLISILLGFMWGGCFEGNLMELAGPWVFLYLVGSHIVYCEYRNTIGRDREISQAA